MNRTILGYRSGLQLFIAICIMVTPVPEVVAESGALEEITVTARKREENLQNLGLSVSALSKTEIERTFARDARDLASMAPNLILDDTSQGPGGNAAIYIRGVGVADVEKNFDPAVGVTVDGLFIGANSGAIFRSLDLQRVEVLRGPQGTLYGRNTIGGTINVERTRPTDEFGGKVRAGYGDYDTLNFDGVINTGRLLDDKFAVKLSGASHNQREGYFTNTNNGDDNGRVDYKSLGANLLFNPTDNLEFEYTVQIENTDQDTPPLLNVGQGDTLFCNSPDPRIGGHCAPDVNTPTSGDRFKVNTLGFVPTTASTNNIAFQATPVGTEIPVRLEATFDTETHIVEGHWDVNDSYTVDYIFGHYETQETIISNWTAESVMLFGTDRPAEYEQQSHELRLSYDAGGRLNFVLGGFLWDSEYDIRLRSWITFVDPTLVFDIAQTTHQETESKAVFFEGDYAITDALTLNLGGRYTEDEKLSLQSLNQPGRGSESWAEFTPKAGLRYQWNDDLLTYFTYTKGYRSGGFNGRVDSLETAEIPYDPEFVENYEGGFKSEWPNQNLRLNGAIFYMEYTDKQEEIGLPSTGLTGQRITVFNAASATMKGAELEMQWAPSEGLTVGANLGYLDTEYDEFTFFDGFVTQDLSDSEFRRAPEWNGSLDATYEWQVGPGLAWVRGAYHYIGSHFLEQTNRPELENDGSHLLDMSVNYAMNNGATFSLFGRNLTDEDTYAHGLNVSGLWAYASPRAPRTWGAEIVYTFGE